MKKLLLALVAAGSFALGTPEPARADVVFMVVCEYPSGGFALDLVSIPGSVADFRSFVANCRAGHGRLRIYPLV